jgi:hypothetical protein
LALLPLLFALMAGFEWGLWSDPFTADSSSRLPHWMRRLNYLYFYALLLVKVSGDFWPGRRILQAIARFEGAESQVKNAQLWVEGCRTMIAQGVPSPMAEAQAEVDRWARERDRALADLQALGYRARLTRT